MKPLVRTLHRGGIVESVKRQCVPYYALGFPLTRRSSPISYQSSFRPENGGVIVAPLLRCYSHWSLSGANEWWVFISEYSVMYDMTCWCLVEVDRLRWEFGCLGAFWPQTDNIVCRRKWGQIKSISGRPPVAIKQLAMLIRAHKVSGLFDDIILTRDKRSLLPISLGMLRTGHLVSEFNNLFMLSRASRRRPRGSYTTHSSSFTLLRWSCRTALDACPQDLK